MFNIRTDLALEAKEIYENDQKSTEIPGVKVKNKDLENCKVSIVEVIDEQGSKIMNKGIGKYVTLESNLMKFDDDESREEMITYLKDELVEILGSDKTKKTLVIGLGNWNITSDALGPKSVSKTLVTRHIFKNYNKDYDDDFTEVSALSPGVMGITGLETSETVKSIKVTYILQKWNGSKWVNVASKTATAYDASSAHKSYTISGLGSGKYRCKASSTVTGYNGYAESLSGYSSSISL